MSLESKLRERIQEMLLDEINSLEEASVTANVPGYNTPYAFSDPEKDKKKKKKRDLGSTGYSYVKEDLDPYKDFGTDNSWEKEYDLNLGAFVEHYQDLVKFMKKHKPVPDKNKRAWAHAIRKKIGKPMLNGHMSQMRNIMDLLKQGDKFRNLPDKAGWVMEGKYHDYRNDESLTPKQKIGRSMREVRNSLTELSKLIDMNVRLKNELNVDSGSYWKNTHKALHKISERLVKLANKVGRLQ